MIDMLTYALFGWKIRYKQSMAGGYEFGYEGDKMSPLAFV